MHYCEGKDAYCYGRIHKVSCGTYIIDGKSVRLCGACVERETKQATAKAEAKR